jgi:hypothetical protein
MMMNALLRIPSFAWLGLAFGVFILIGIAAIYSVLPKAGSPSRRTRARAWLGVEEWRHSPVPCATPHRSGRVPERTLVKLTPTPALNTLGKTFTEDYVLFLFFK